MRALVLVEGQTEERFVKDLLAPSYAARGLYLIPTILGTKRVKDGPHFKGGVTTFGKFERDIRRLLHGVGGDGIVTTMVDYYGLPDDFPGMDTRPDGASGIDRARHVESAIRTHFGNTHKLLPFLVVHEFEALLYSAEDALPDVLTRPDLRQSVSRLRAQFASPEDINEHPESSPSHRIRAMCPAYRKVLHGPSAANRLGLDTIRGACPHFAEWLHALEAASGIA